MTTLINNTRGVMSYTLFRQDGGTTASPIATIPLTTAYATFAGDGATPGTPITFKDDVALAATPSVVYPETGGFTSQGMQFINDSAGNIFYSLDGINDHMELKPNENIVFDFIRAQRIWLRGTAGGEAYRLLVW